MDLTEEQGRLPVTIITAISPVRFLAIRTQDADSESFKKFEIEFNKYLHAVGSYSDSRSMPERGQLVAVRDQKRKWHRGCVNYVMSRIGRFDVLVFLVDAAVELNIPIQWVRELPERFLYYPFQACELHLPGLVPCSVIVERDLNVAFGEVLEWDPSAVEFVRRLTKDKADAQIEVLEKIDRMRFKVRLHMLVFGSFMCINDALVKREFAVVSDLTCGTVNQAVCSGFGISNEKRCDASISFRINDKHHKEIIDLQKNADIKNLYIKEDADLPEYDKWATACKSNFETNLGNITEQLQRPVSSRLAEHSNKENQGHEEAFNYGFQFYEECGEYLRAVPNEPPSIDKKSVFSGSISSANMKPPCMGDNARTPVKPTHIGRGRACEQAFQQQDIERNRSISLNQNLQPPKSQVPVQQRDIERSRSALSNQNLSSFNNPAPPFTKKTMARGSPLVPDMPSLSRLNNFDSTSTEQYANERRGSQWKDSTEYHRDARSDAHHRNAGVNRQTLSSRPTSRSKPSRRITVGQFVDVDLQQSSVPQFTSVPVQQQVVERSRSALSNRNLSWPANPALPFKKETMARESPLFPDMPSLCRVDDFGSTSTEQYTNERCGLQRKESTEDHSNTRSFSHFQRTRGHVPYRNTVVNRQMSSSMPTSRSVSSRSSTVGHFVDVDSRQSSVHEFPLNNSATIRIQHQNQPVIPYYIALSSNDPLEIVGELGVVRRILVCGPFPTSPVKTIEEARFNGFLKSIMPHLGFHYPSTIQAYVWPAIVRGRNIAVVSGPRSGQTTAYLLPLLSNILDGKLYANIPQNNEPLVLILCATWRKTTSIYNAAMKILDHNRSLKLYDIHSGNYESQKMFLINRCDVLIATPCALLRLLNETDCLPVTGFSRLCHVVLDDADVLTDIFGKEVADILRFYTDELKHRDWAEKCNQIMAFSNKWTDKLKAFIKVMASPLLFCSDFCESMVYAGVPAVVHTFKHKERLQNFIDDIFKPYLATNSGMVVICMERTKDANKLFSAINGLSLCKNIQLVNHNFEMPKLLWACKWWTDSQKSGIASVLVVTDRALELLKIDDADCLFHYDIPEFKKGQFGRRSACLLKHMRKTEVLYEKNAEASASSCVIHLILTDKRFQHASSLITLLKRLSCQLPNSLIALALGFYEHKEVEKQPIPLCYYLKAYGKCANSSVCTDRHLLLPAIDAPSEWLLPGVDVRFLVTCVRNASHFYGQIVDFKTMDGVWSKHEDVYQSLVTNMAVYYECAENRIPLPAPKLGDMGAVCVNSVFHRVKVLYKEFISEENIREVQVFFLDDGSFEYVEVTRVLYLPDELAKVPQEAYEIFLCNVGPVDNDVAWTPNANEFVNLRISKKEMIGKIKLSMGNTLWLTAVAMMTKLKFSNDYIREFELRADLLSNGYAMEVPNHMTNLEAFTSTVFELSPPIQMKNTKLDAECAFLPIDEEVDVFVSCLLNPGQFYVQANSTVDCFDDLMKEIQVHVKGCTNKGLPEVFNGSLCLAPKTGSTEYYRARILKTPNAARNHLPQDENVLVFLADCGDTLEVKAGDLLPLPYEFFWKLPLQAIECSLSGVIPIEGNEWSEDASIVMKNMCLDGGNRMLFSAKVVKNMGKNPNTLQNRYKVVLCDGSYEVADELVYSNLAKDEDDGSNTDKMDSLTEVMETSNKEDAIVCDISQETNSVSSMSEDCSNSGRDKKSVETTIPFVKWSQRIDKVMFKFMIANVTEDSIDVNGSTINYRATAKGVVYAMQLELFAEVCEGAESTVSDPHVRLTLKKTSQKRWPRLTSKTEKLPYVSVDYDTWLDSSDEEEQLNVDQWNSVVNEAPANPNFADMGVPAGIMPNDATYQAQNSASSSDDDDDDECEGYVDFANDIFT